MFTSKKFPTLSKQNRDVLERYTMRLPQDSRRAVLDELQHCYESTTEPKPPQRGELAPNFTLEDAHGKTHTLSEYKQPVVLSFFRGGWCDFCTTALSALQRRYPAITVHGGEVLAISPDTVEENRHTARRFQLKFPILSDPGSQTAASYGLRDNIAALVTSIFEKYNVEFPAHEERFDIPYPATFILLPAGEIETLFIDKDPAVRMRPSDIAGIIRDMKFG